jgi:phosphonate transport system permease protein
MAVTDASAHGAFVSDDGRYDVERHWRELNNTKRLYTIGGLIALAVALIASLWFANETNAGKFLDRLPHFFDFVGDMIPRDGWEVFRALFDLESPYDTGSLKYNYPVGRVYITESLYVPEYFYKMLETLNIALLATFIGFTFGFILCFVAAKNLTTSRWLRFFSRRFMEILRAFPEIVIAGFFLAIFSLGPIPAIIAVAIHTIGALGKMFFEVVENADMKPEEGLRAVGANWFERVWFGIVPAGSAELHQLLPAALRNQRARLDHHRRGRCRRHRRGAQAIDQPRPRSQDARNHPLAVRDDRHLRSTSFRRGCARRVVGDQAFTRVHGAAVDDVRLTADQLDEISSRVIRRSSTGNRCWRVSAIRARRWPRWRSILIFAWNLVLLHRTRSSSAEPTGTSRGQLSGRLDLLRGASRHRISGPARSGS